MNLKKDTLYDDEKKNQLSSRILTLANESNTPTTSMLPTSPSKGPSAGAGPQGMVVTLNNEITLTYWLAATEISFQIDYTGTSWISVGINRQAAMAGGDVVMFEPGKPSVCSK